MNRLSRTTLSEARDGVTLPPPAGLSERTGIVHLGIGAFHRAHQAVFTEDAATAAQESGWGICGVTQRSAAVLEQLRPQDCLYAVLERGPHEPAVRVVGQVREVLFAAEDGELLRRRFADPATRVITLTVTEKGYRRSASGGLDLQDPVVRSDLSGGARSAVGQLVRGLQARAAESGAPVTVLSCDNLTDNGDVVQRLVADFCAALPSAEGDPLAAWIAENVAFPCSMVDRIVPATTEDDRATAAQLLGLNDAALVVAEPFRQWVIEDRFAAGRPAWERAGAEVVGDVTPYEQLKLRMLNGTHSMLAYLGALRGYETIAEAVADAELAEAAARLMRDDVAPTLAPTPGRDVAAYAGEVLERFANPALRHRTTQVAMDGSQKLPLRLLGTVRDRLAAGETPHWATLAVAGWMVFVASARDPHGREIPVDDPLADRLREAAGEGKAPGALVDGLLGVTEVFGADLPAQTAFREELTAQVAELLAQTRAGQPATQS